MFFINEFKPIKYKNFPSIPYQLLLMLPDVIINKSIILQTVWYEHKLPEKFKTICLCYYSPSNNDNKDYHDRLIKKMSQKNIYYLLNFTHKDYYNYPFNNKYLIGDIHIDNLLYMKNLPKVDIVYFPNYAVQCHENGNNQNVLANNSMYVESKIIYNVLQKYKNKYSIITLPHCNNITHYYLNGFKFINPKFNNNNIEFIPNAKVIINSCKSFAGVCMTLNKPLIHIAANSPITFLPCIEDFVKKGSYYLENFNEDTFEEALISALNDEKYEIGNEIDNKYKKEIYDENIESPTEKLKKIIDKLI